MSDTLATPGWTPMTALDDGEVRGRLLGAFLTTYDPPDPAVLIEEYLPAWLGLENSYADEGVDRLRYFAELEDALRRLKGQFTIISSAGEVATTAEAWIWNYVRRLEVGARGPAVQHAKLWMFHRAEVDGETPETIEIIISSTNLTRDGLRGQLQAGWRCVLPLDPRGSQARLDEWEPLPAFLVELGSACGASGATAVAPWLALLRRCECPSQVSFLASVPGKHEAATLARRRSAWGVAGVRAMWAGRGAPKMCAITPTIGRWTEASWKTWARAAGVETSRFSVAWVRAAHPWSASWQLDPSSETALTRAGVQWLELASPDEDDWQSPFCEEHTHADQRWSHAKLYELSQANRRQLLITSANLSQAAWGTPRRDGTLEIDNFELGVVVHTPEPIAAGLGSGPFKRTTCEVDYTRPQEDPIAWLAAEWDGTRLTISCRARAGTRLARTVEIMVARGSAARKVGVRWTGSHLLRAHIKWPIAKGVPILARIATATGFARTIAVHDTRDHQHEQPLCGEFSEAELREALEQLIEEKYGYVSLTEPSGTKTPPTRGKGAIVAADYGVPAYVDARRRFQFIDNWSAELENALEHDRRFILRDGALIRDRWHQAAGSSAGGGVDVAARVAVDELTIRIRRST